MCNHHHLASLPSPLPPRRLSNPHYPPEVQAEAALINFTVTEAGLEEQLLALTVQKERPDLALQKSELIKQQNAFKIKARRGREGRGTAAAAAPVPAPAPCLRPCVQIKELEDGILKRLAEAEGDITEDRELIEGLENTKRIATDIAEKSAIAAQARRMRHRVLGEEGSGSSPLCPVQTTVEINLTSEKYRPVAHRAALLFFLLMDLFRVHSVGAGGRHLAAVRGPIPSPPLLPPHCSTTSTR